jgi:hypothetical protein
VNQSSSRRVAIAAAFLVGTVYLATLVVFANVGAWQLVDLVDAIGFSIWVAAFTVVGVIIAFNRPGNAVAWICLGFGAVWSVWMFADGLLTYEAANPGTLTRPDLLAALVDPMWVPGVGLIGFLLLLFPDGRLPSPRWRPVAWTLGATILVPTVTAFFLPGVIQDREYVNPLGVEAMAPWDEGIPGMALVLTLVLCILASAVSVVVRFRRSVGIERLQLKWIMAAAVVAALAYALLFFWDEFMIQFVWAAIPIAIGLSMHRHRLYDIDRLISRTVSYALVVGTLLIAYSGMVFAVGALPLEGSIEVAAATLAVAALFNPVRKRIQTVVDRKFNRSRYDAEVVVEDFANGLRNETDGDRILRGWMGVVSETMEPSSVGVWTR